MLRFLSLVTLYFGQGQEITMIFTLGHRKSYLLGLAKATAEKPLRKTGWYRSSDGVVYPGGSVWETSEEVWSHIDAEGERLKEYSVFSVDAVWEGGTLLTPNLWRSLAKSAKILEEIQRKTNDNKIHTPS